MIETSQREGRELAELLSQQRDVYRQLRELAQSQSSAIHDDRPEALLQILSQRQRLITELTEINRHLEPFRSRWDSIRQGLPPGDRLRVAELVEEVEKLLGEILQNDEADSESLRTRSRQVKVEAATVTTGRTLNAAYASRSYNQPAGQFIDRCDEGGGL